MGNSSQDQCKEKDFIYSHRLILEDVSGPFTKNISIFVLIENVLIVI